jgi:hypothetical protein
LNISDTNIRTGIEKRKKGKAIYPILWKQSTSTILYVSDRIGFKLFFFSYRQGNLEKSIFIIGIDVTIFTKLFSWYLEPKCFIKVNITLSQASLVWNKQRNLKLWLFE